jgi:superfamily II RNA helicase
MAVDEFVAQDAKGSNLEAPTRDQLAAAYLDQLPYEPYPVQEEALLNWFTASQGVLVCAPTGMAAIGEFRTKLAQRRGDAEMAFQQRRLHTFIFPILSAAPRLCARSSSF